jgi:hypothetical protein
MEEEGWLWKIPLTKNKVVVDWALCSEEDYAALSKHTWQKTKNGYVRSSNGKIDGHYFMHRYVKHFLEGLPVEKNKLVDHIHGNKLDNRRKSLFVATQPQNAQNRKKSSRGVSSTYIGVNGLDVTTRMLTRRKRATCIFYNKMRKKRFCITS